MTYRPGITNDLHNRLRRVVAIRLVEEFDIAALIKQRLSLKLPSLWPEETLKDEFPTEVFEQDTFKNFRKDVADDDDEFWTEQFPYAEPCVIYPITTDNPHNPGEASDLYIIVFQEGVVAVAGLKTEDGIVKYGGSLFVDKGFAHCTHYDGHVHKLILRIWTNLRHFVVEHEQNKFNLLGADSEMDRNLIVGCPYEMIHYTHPSAIDENELNNFKDGLVTVDSKNGPKEYIYKHIALLRGYWTPPKFRFETRTDYWRSPLPKDLINPRFLKMGNRNLFSELLAIAKALRSCLVLRSYEELVRKQCHVLPLIQQATVPAGVWRSVLLNFLPYSPAITLFDKVPKGFVKTGISLDWFVKSKSCIADNFVTHLGINFERTMSDAPDMYWHNKQSYSLWRAIIKHFKVQNRVKVMKYRHDILTEAIKTIDEDASVAAEMRAMYTLTPLLVVTLVATVLNHPVGLVPPIPGLTR